MLKFFEVENYKNFKESISIDFTKVGGYQFSTECITEQLIGKMIVYGRNATGKTNLGRALFDITDNLYLMFQYVPIDSLFKNADSSEQLVRFKYIFQFDNDEIIYQYKKKSNTVLYEEELFLNNKQIFKFNFDLKKFEYGNLDYLNAGTIVVERYLKALYTQEENEANIEKTLPFLRWIINNTALSNQSVLLKLDDYVSRMTTITVSNVVGPRTSRFYDSFWNSLEDKEELNKFEEFLNIMGIECELMGIKTPDGQNQIYFKHAIPVPFYENASSGTRALVNIYRRLEMGKQASLMYLDEFDAFYHYEMSNNVLKYFKKKYPKSQIILTTHNTNLITNRLMRPDCLFILSRDGRLTPLCDATPRELREGHNLEKMYISGEFDKYE